MKHFTFPILATAALLLSGQATAAATTATAGDGKTTTQSAQSAKPVFQPPLRGAPTRRVGGATRGSDDADLVVTVLAPQGTGLTSRSDPSLYWYLSGETDRQAEFTLIRNDVIEPIAETKIQTPRNATFAMVSLADLGISLEPGVTYEWSIALIADPDNRSSDIVTSGTVMYKQPDGALMQTLETAQGEARVAAYGRSGYWYDAIEAAGPSDRAELLDQVELPKAAAHARSQ